MVATRLLIQSKSLFNRNVAFMGDSRTSQSTSVSGTEYNKLSQGYIGWLQFLTRQRFDFALTDNYGVSGETTTQMLARFATMLAATTAHTIVILGGTNDRSAGDTAATTIANLTSMRDLALAAGRRVVFITELPKGDSVSTSARLSATQLAYHMRTRQWMLDQRTTPGCYAADPWQYLADRTVTTGDFGSVNYTKDDGIHPTPLGAYYIALALKPIFEAIFPPIDFLPQANSDVYDATNNPYGCLNANPMMSGTAGTENATGGSGDLADSWSENAGPTWTRAYSKVVSGGKNWQQVIIGGTGTTSGVSMRQVITSGNLAIGDTVYGFADVEFDASMANVSQLALQLLDNNTITSGDFRRALSTEVVPNVASAISGVMRTPNYVLTTTTLQLQFNMLVLNAVTPAATIRLASVGCRKV